MPEELFKSPGANSTHTKTCLLVAEKKSRPSKSFYMAELRWCGHDSRGKTIPRNDFPKAQAGFAGFRQGAKALAFGYPVLVSDLNGNILCPRYYDRSVIEHLKTLSNTHHLRTVRELTDEGLLSFATGHEVGKLAYGTGEVPFIRTSDISNWEIKSDPKHCVSDAIYQSLKRRQDVREGDILFVRDGTYLIGSCGFVSKYDTKIIYQSHIFKIRCLDWDGMSPYLLLAALSCDPVMKQIKAKRFTLDIIDTIGNRIFELVLPVPKDKLVRRRIEDVVRKSIEDRIEARELARQARLDVCSPKA
jgi:type I restriction enzyme M protein